MIFQQGIPKIDKAMYRPAHSYASTNQWLSLIFDSLTGAIDALHNILNWTILYLTPSDESMALLHVEAHWAAASDVVRSSSPASCVGGILHFRKQQLNGHLLATWDAHIILILYQQGFYCLSLGTLPIYSGPKWTWIRIKHSTRSSFFPRQC